MSAYDPQGGNGSGGKSSSFVRLPRPANSDAQSVTAAGRNRHHYGGQRHVLSLTDRLGARVERALDAEFDLRDPAFIARLTPMLRVLSRYFDATVEGFENLPATGPFLVVGNHSGGIFMPDYWAFLHRWIEARGSSEPLYALAYDFLFSIPGVSALARRLGAVPANHEIASQLLRRGAAVIVYPGGDQEDYRPWSERHHVDLRGHTGFVRLALREHVPVVPLVSHGSHDVIIVLSRGETIAHRLGLERLRIRVFPVTLGPAGIVPLQLVTWPLPAKVTTHICDPIDWTHLPQGSADDPATVRHCYEQVLGRMQATLDDLVSQSPHPLLDRARSALAVDRLTRLSHRTTLSNVG